MLKVEVVVVTLFAQNCRVLWDAGSDLAAVVDPGGDVERILEKLGALGLKCDQIWLTHSHLDHCGGVAELKRRCAAKLSAHRSEIEFRKNLQTIAAMYGVSGMENCPEPDTYLEEGDCLTLGQLKFDVLFTPGHSPGHLCFFEPQSQTLIAGDTLFQGSIGRTDLPGGDHPTLLRSIREKIFSLTDATKVLPGHGPDTEVRIERDNNPFFN